MNDWKQEFEKLMLSGFVTEAKDYKDAYVPSSLFKYRQLNTLTLLALQKNAFWVSDATTMNDPYESTIHLDYEAIANTILANAPVEASDIAEFQKLGYPEDTLKKIQTSGNIWKSKMQLLRSVDSDPEKFDERLSILEAKSNAQFNLDKENFINLLRSIVRFCSFSERNDSLLMWSHYASQHEGICIEYEIGNIQYIKDNTYPVLYSAKPFDATSYILDKQLAIWISILASLYKSEDWAYEKEWRFTIPNNILTKNQALKIGAPKGIFLGSQISKIMSRNRKKILHQILDHAKTYDIPVFDMELDRTAYMMTPKQRLL